MLKITIFSLVLFYISIINGKVTKEDVYNAKKMLTQLSVSENRCTEPADCATAPIGDNTCGGPNDYIFYSKLSSYADYIEKLAPLTSKLEAEYNKENSVHSICTQAGAPTITCSFNVCRRTSMLYSIMYPIGRS